MMRRDASCASRRNPGRASRTTRDRVRSSRTASGTGSWCVSWPDRQKTWRCAPPRQAGTGDSLRLTEQCMVAITPIPYHRPHPAARLSPEPRPRRRQARGEGGAWSEPPARLSHLATPSLQRHCHGAGGPWVADATACSQCWGAARPAWPAAIACLNEGGLVMTSPTTTGARLGGVLLIALVAVLVGSRAGVLALPRPTRPRRRVGSRVPAGAPVPA